MNRTQFINIRDRELTMSNTTTNSHPNAQNASPRDQLSPNDRTSSLINLFAPQPRYEGSDRSSLEFLSKIILEISFLKGRLEHPERQDLYFRLGIEGSQQRLASLKQQFNSLKEEVNQSDAGVLREEIKSVQEFLVWYKKHSWAGFIQSMVISTRSSQIRHLELILGLKTDVGYIKALSYYL